MAPEADLRHPSRLRLLCAKSRHAERWRGRPLLTEMRLFHNVCEFSFIKSPLGKHRSPFSKRQESRMSRHLRFRVNAEERQRFENAVFGIGAKQLEACAATGRDFPRHRTAQPVDSRLSPTSPLRKTGILPGGVRETVAGGSRSSARFPTPPAL